jgi:hypothetical protein
VAAGDKDPLGQGLVVAKEWEDGYLLTFAFAKRTGHVIHNFEHTPVLEDEFLPALLRPVAGNVEAGRRPARTGN